MMKDKEVFAFAVQSAPIIIMLAYFLYPYESVAISHTVLGKLIAVSLIVLYSFQHIVYGFFVAVLMVWYYQLDSHVRFTEGFDKSAYLPKPAKKRGSMEGVKATLEDDHTEYSKAYVDQLEPLSKEGEALFREKHCKAGKVQHKNISVDKNENIPHLHPGFKFRKSPCNPCSETCRFEVAKQKTETQLRGMETRGLESLQNWIPFISSGVPYVGTGKDQATMFG